MGVKAGQFKLFLLYKKKQWLRALRAAKAFLSVPRTRDLEQAVPTMCPQPSGQRERGER